MLKDKIQGLLLYRGKMNKDFAKKLNIHQFSLPRKYKTDNFSIQDFLELAEFTNTELAFVDRNDNDKILCYLTKEDLISKKG